MNYIPMDTVLNNRYIVKERVGVGGMAVVYRGYDKVNNTDVALKVLKPEFAVEEQNIVRFKKEAESAYRLNHPHIVKIFGIGHCSGIHYIAMQYIDGITLTEYMEKCGVFSWKNAFEIVAQILSALSVAHAAGVIHRDIKPQNILVDENMHVTLTDFGIAQDTITSSTINANTSACSVHYLSPEQARGSMVDGRSDIYSLGITLYEMLVGAVPFDGESTVAVAIKHLQGKITPPCEVDDSIPRGVSDLVMMATMRDMGKRFQSADEMLAQMRIVSQNENVSFWTPPVERVFSEESKVIEGAEPIRIPYMDTEDEASSADDFCDEDVKRYNPPEKDTDSNTAENVPSEDLDEGESEDGGDDSEEYSDEDFVPDEKDVIRARNMRIAGKIITYTVASIIAIILMISVVYACQKIAPARGDAAKKYRISNYEGHLASEVVSALEAAGIRTNIESVNSDKYPIGYIVWQNKGADEKLSPGETITLRVSSAADTVVLEDYSGKTKRVIENTLRNLGLIVNFEEVPGKGAAEGEVLRIVPGVGSVVPKGSTVTVYISSGVICNEVVVPDLVGDGKVTLSQAITMLQNLNLNVGNVFPNPGENIVDLFATPTPESTENPFSSETPDAEPSGSDSPVASVSPTAKPTAKPTSKPISKPTGGASTDIPTAVPTEPSTELPTEAPTEEPTPEPTPVPIFASNYVVSQYPPAGTVLYEGDTVDLFFYASDELINAEETVVQTLELPMEIQGEFVNLIKFDYKLADGTVVMYSMSNVPTESFPVKFNVPFSYGSNVTEVYVYVNDMTVIYEKRIVTK